MKVGCCFLLLFCIYIPISQPPVKTSLSYINDVDVADTDTDTNKKARVTCLRSRHIMSLSHIIGLCIYYIYLGPGGGWVGWYAGKIIRFGFSPYFCVSSPCILYPMECYYIKQ